MKTFTGWLAVAMCFCGSQAFSQTCPQGQLIMQTQPANVTIWSIVNGAKRPLVGLGAFKQCVGDVSRVTQLPLSQINAMPDGEPFAVDGTFICEADAACSSVYEVTNGGRLSAIRDMGAYIAAGGSDKVAPLNDPVVAHPPATVLAEMKKNPGPDIATGPQGKICRENNGPGVCGPDTLGHPINTPCQCSTFNGHWGQ